MENRIQFDEISMLDEKKIIKSKNYYKFLKIFQKTQNHSYSARKVMTRPSMADFWIRGPFLSKCCRFFRPKCFFIEKLSFLDINSSSVYKKKSSPGFAPFFYQKTTILGFGWHPPWRSAGAGKMDPKRQLFFVSGRRFSKNTNRVYFWKIGIVRTRKAFSSKKWKSMGPESQKPTFIKIHRKKISGKKKPNAESRVLYTRI